MNIKATFNTKERCCMRRFRAKSYTDFLEKIKIFQPESDISKLTFTYVDTEKDNITFSTDGEWEEAKSQVNDINLLRVTISDGTFNCRPFRKSYVRKCPWTRSRFGRFSGYKRNSRFHWGVQCDGCKVKNFTGVRNKCKDCPNYDLCENCFEKKESIHPKHSFVEIKKRNQRRNWRFGPLNIQVKKVEVKPKVTKMEKKKDDTKKCKKKSEIIVIDDVKMKKKLKEEPKKEIKKEEKKKKKKKKKRIVKYERELEMLKKMGFLNEEMNLFLLEKRRGNLQRVVQVLLEK